jgi:hypothetical protein
LTWMSQMTNETLPPWPSSCTLPICELPLIKKFDDQFLCSSLWSISCKWSCECNPHHWNAWRHLPPQCKYLFKTHLKQVALYTMKSYVLKIMLYIQFYKKMQWKYFHYYEIKFKMS